MERSIECQICGESSHPISIILHVCLDCIRNRHKEALPFIKKAHFEAKKTHGLPGQPAKTVGGINCNLCSNHCSIGNGEHGFCGIRWNEDGLKSHTSKDMGLYYSYIDPHVTNCCAAWFCPAGTGAGYPKYAFRNGPEYGYSNLAVFMYGCNFNCLFCQNPSHKNFIAKPTPTYDIANQVRANHRISCICYFGGSPEPQLPFILEASREAIEAKKDKPLRICFEWNGCGQPSFVKRAAEIALETGGNIKFDLKCYTPELSLALSGVSNKRAFKNFEMIAQELYPKRKDLPVLSATTLLVPSYVDTSEVESIAEFIADINPAIPYGLLAFHPAYLMKDMPYSSLKHVIECYRVAKRHLEQVHVGNLHIIGMTNMSQFISAVGKI